MAYSLADVAEAPPKKSYSLNDVAEVPSAQEKSLFQRAKDVLPFVLSPGPAFTQSETGQAFFKGAGRGATFGAMGNTGLEGSVMEPHPMARKTGEIFGVAAPLLAAEATGGASLGAASAMRGAGVFGQAVARGAGTGMLFEGMKGALTGRPALETVGEAMKTGLMFAGFGAGGQALGYLRKVFGETWADGLSNAFINTERRIAEKLVEQGKPSLGGQALDKTDLAGFHNRKEVYDMAGEELFQLENRIKFRLQEDTEALKVATPSRTPASGLLEHKPGEVQVVGRPGHTSGPTISPPTTVTESVPARTIPFSRDAEELEKDVFGVSVRSLKSEASTPKLFPQTDLGGFERSREVGSIPGESPAAGTRPGLGEQFRNLNALPERGFKAQRPGTIDLTEVADSLNGVKKRLNTGTETAAINKLSAMQQGFLNHNGEVAGKEGAMRLKRMFDDLAGNIYLKDANAKSAFKAEAYEDMANNLRKQIYDIDPQLGEMAAQESLMIRIQIGLKPQIAKSGGFIPRSWASLVNTIEGSPVSNLASKGLRKVFGKPSKVLAPATRIFSRTAAAQESE